MFMGQNPKHALSMMWIHSNSPRQPLLMANALRCICLMFHVKGRFHSLHNASERLLLGWLPYAAHVWHPRFFSQKKHHCCYVGVLTSDPRLVKGARPVPDLTYDEATELAFFGATVLHPQAMQPAFQQQLQNGNRLAVRVKNSYNR